MIYPYYNSVHLYYNDSRNRMQVGLTGENLNIFLNTIFPQKVVICMEVFYNMVNMVKQKRRKTSEKKRTI